MSESEKLKTWLKLSITAVVLIVIFSLCGCNGANTIPVDTGNLIPATPIEATMKAVAKTNWFGTFCLLSFFGGVVAIGLDQRKIGSAVIIAAIATLCLGLAINRFPTWLAIIGFVSSIVAAAYSILIKNKGLAEIIKGVQYFREKEDITALDGYLNDEESKSTKKLVKRVKLKI